MGFDDKVKDRAEGVFAKRPWLKYALGGFVVLVLLLVLFG